MKLHQSTELVAIFPVSSRIIDNEWKIGLVVNPTTLADEMVPKSQQKLMGYSESASSLTNGHVGMFEALDFILSESTTSLSIQSRNCRRLIRLLAAHASQNTIMRMEAIWRAVICRRAKLLFSDTESGTFWDPTPEKILRVVETLCFSLAKARAESINVMSVTKRSGLSADTAILEAFRLQRDDVKIEIEKTLAVQLSSLLDDLKLKQYQHHQFIGGRSWDEGFNQIVQLIQVLFFKDDLNLFLLSVWFRFSAVNLLAILCSFMNYCLLAGY